MVCSHCNQSGHTYRGCPTITEEEKKDKAKKIKEKKEATAEKRRVRQEMMRVRQERIREAQRIAQADQKKDYEIVNTTDYDIAMYWVMNDANTLRRFTYSRSHETTTFRCIQARHRIVAFPFLEVCENNGLKAKKVIHEGEAPYVSVFDMKMKDFDGNTIVIDCEYKPKKTEVDQWKDCAIKSKYLLDQILKLTGGVDTEGNVSKEEYENLAPMLDMIQDISMPDCDEVDKEQAGVPSLLTNVT